MKRKISMAFAMVIIMAITSIGVPAYAQTKVDISTSADSVSLEYTQTVYTGTELKPVVTVSYLGAALIQDIDFTATYSSNINCGTATIAVTGIGGYEGTVVKTFDIVPDKVAKVKISKWSTTSYTLSWNAVFGAQGYIVYSSTSADSNFKSVKSTSSTSYKVSKQSAAKTRYYKVVAYGDSAKRYCGVESDVFVGSTAPKNVTLLSVTKKGSSIKVKWKKTSCKKYEIQYSTDKKFKSGVKKVYASSSATTKTIKGLSKKKVYYARVRAYTSDSSSKKIYGSSSKKLSTNYSKKYATYTSNYVNNASRTNNLKIASKKINGTIIEPGETFSFNKVVGERTTGKGYKSAHVFAGANSTVMGVGGGVCQVASTIFNTALYANVKITERHQHSQRVTYVPKGRDAAIYWGSEDFKWTNNTGYPIKMVMNCSNGKITCSFYVCEDVSPKKVKLSVNYGGGTFTLKRSVGGKVNYTCRSRY